MTSTKTAQEFIEALQHFETTGDSKALVELFDDGAELSRLGREPQTGKDGAQQFWDDYRNSFGKVASNFSQVNAEGPVQVLEWSSEGSLPNGDTIRYRGVTLLEWNETKVQRLRTYFDSSALTAPIPEPAPEATTRRVSEAV